MMSCQRLFTDLNRLAHSPEGEVRLVRELASRVAAAARTPRMAAIRQRWRDVMALRRPDRPPVWCNPVGCWSELLPEGELVCRQPRCRELEVYCKRALIKLAIGDDTPINDYYMVSALFTVTPGNIWGIDIQRETLGETGSAWRYQPVLLTPADFDRLQVPRYQIDRVATAALRGELETILGETMPVKISPISGYFSEATLCKAATDLRGMEPLMLDMLDAPELVHRLMEIVCQGVLAKIEAIAAAGDILPNNDGPMFLSDPLRPGHTPPWTLQDCWVHGNSQEFDQISPAMFEEFLLDYQKRIFARFGAVCYGCCESLTRKLDAVLSIPNLKLLTCSGWTDLPALVQRVGSSCCIMWRHKASEVVCPDDLSAFARQLEKQAEILRGCHYQVVLRELQTLMGHPQRLEEWTRLTIQTVEKHAG